MTTTIITLPSDTRHTLRGAYLIHDHGMYILEINEMFILIILFPKGKLNIKRKRNTTVTISRYNTIY